MKDKFWHIYVPVLVVLAIFVTWYFYLFHGRKAVNVDFKTYLVVQDSTGGYLVTDTIYTFMKRADRMEKEIYLLRDKYQSEVDLMVDKANGWLAFWIGVLALVIGLMSIWQIYRQRNSENEFRLLKEDMNKTFLRYYRIEKQRINKAIDDTISGLKKEISTLEMKLQKNQQTLRGSKLSSLMMCLCSFPDPQMTANITDKKRQMKEVLRHVSDTFHEYAESSYTEINEKANASQNVFLVLTVVKLAVVRTHGVYSDIHQNIMIQKILDYIAETNKKILDGEIANQLPERVKKIDVDLKDLLRVIE